MRMDFGGGNEIMRCKGGEYALIERGQLQCEDTAQSYHLEND